MTPTQLVELRLLITMAINGMGMRVVLTVVKLEQMPKVGRFHFLLVLLATIPSTLPASNKRAIFL